MSWKRVQRRATEILDRAQLRNEDIVGKWVDVEALMKDVEETGGFRAMIQQNIAMFIRSRGGFAKDPPRVRGGQMFDVLDKGQT